MSTSHCSCYCHSGDGNCKRATVRNFLCEIFFLLRKWKATFSSPLQGKTTQGREYQQEILHMKKIPLIFHHPKSTLVLLDLATKNQMCFITIFVVKYDISLIFFLLYLYFLLVVWAFLDFINSL